jgi:outer membrane protein OmpA-like peptidoglycan-associated protein
MPSYVDFDTTKHFRDFIIGKTLTVPNGPQTFTASDYVIQSTSDMANVDPGAVDTNRTTDLKQPQTSNVFKPTEYFVTENLETIPRKANLNLYPYFVDGNYHSFISILSTSDYSTESELMKFAAWNIRENPEGPMFARLQQNLYTATVGRVRLIDALEGNTSTAINIITGREPLIEKNEKITVASTLPGKGIDFLQQISGIEFPWVEIPGDYLSNPKNPSTNYRPTASTEAGKIVQDITGALGSLIGIQRRPTTTRKPSDLFIEYMGEGPKSTLFDNLSYSKYAPDYTTTARSQNTSKLFNYVDQFAEGFKNMLGLEAPKGTAYIGDDRGNDVKYAMGDFNDRIVKSSYYLSLLFDPIQAELFERKKNIGEGGGIGSNLTWISSRSKNILGENNAEYTSEASLIEESLSTNYAFRDDSILGLTQQILETLPADGGASRSHVANVIDQTSRIFREGDVMMSRGSNVKYVDKFTGQESGVEYCRVWTKDRSYMNYSDTMKRTNQLSRQFEGSVLSRPWNLNIYPNSNGNGAFDSGSTNIGTGGFNNQKNRIESGGGGFYAKKYMFSIENLAWKSSNRPGFTYNDLPYCERGPNGGRVMWFPPYDLKVTEQNSAKWEENIFLGRPEPVYTYQNTSRAGTISFKVIVDHPSILNLLVREHFKGMSDEEADNYINAFFAGCQDVDFYGLIRKYTTLTPVDVEAIKAYLNQNKDTKTIQRYKPIFDPVPDAVVPTNQPTEESFSTVLYFNNDMPTANDAEGLYSTDDYEKLYDRYISSTTTTTYYTDLNTGLTKLKSGTGWTKAQVQDYKVLTGDPTGVGKRPSTDKFNEMTTAVNKNAVDGFATLQANYNSFKQNLATLKSNIKNIKQISVQISSSTSAVADDHYNLDLSYRRSDSVIKDILNKISKDGDGNNAKVTWAGNISPTDKQKIETPQMITFQELGYDQEGTFVIEYVKNSGEQGTASDMSANRNVDCGNANLPVITELKKTAPVTFWCRESTASISYTTQSPDTPAVSAPVRKVKLIPEIPDATTGTHKIPPIDEMKVIIMKTLSECFYFKKLEEESPLQFSSLKEKLRYFHPAFHSMTPEGLNSRLTFLHQCVRPGDTLPIKGVSDQSDLNARNTTFGPPPILIMRIGDFYHSKIIVRDYNVEYEQNLWDLNPEGIGVQPMIANVTLQVNFIGGHGLERPVEILQNALSSNFYANTEIYDPRSTATEDKSKFTKEFLENLMSDYTEKMNSDSQEIPPTETKITEGTYIGTLSIPTDDPPVKTLSYDDVVDTLFQSTQEYFDNFETSYHSILKEYDAKVSAMLLSPTYRTIKNYNVQTGGGSTETIEFLGNYKSNAELSVLARDFQLKLESEIATENITTIFGIHKYMTNGMLDKSERILKPKIKELIGKVIDGIISNSDVKNIERTRNNVIVSLDKLNFIVKTLHDGKISMKSKEYTGANLIDFTYDKLYNTYSNVIDFIQENQSKFSEDLDETYIFNRNTTMTINDFSYFLSVLLKGYKSDILSLYSNDITFLKITNNIEKALNKFMASDPTEKNFRIKKYPIRKDNNQIIFTIQDETFEFSDAEKTELESVHRTSGNKTTSVLNYYR